MPDLEIVDIPPPAPLDRWVRRIAGFRERGAPLRRREIPFPGAVVVFSLGPDMLIDGNWTGSFAAGPYDRPIETAHAGEQAGLQLYLSPLGARAILGVPLDELHDRTVDLADVLPRAGELTERIAEAAGWAARAAVLEEALAPVEAPALPAEVRHAYARLVASGGAVRIEQLARETGRSRRHLSERFRREIGIPPKTFARLLRFQRAVTLLRRGEPLADAAYACGYVDQPHMNRDFRAFLGVPPGELPFVQDGLRVEMAGSRP